MRKYLLECCVDCTESAVTAQNAGADRLEICASLITGGITPTASMYRSISERCGIKKHVLIRPRFGDFCYSGYEFEIMLNEVREFKKLGADGVVIGILTEDGEIDTERTKRLCEAAGDMSVTFHRAFDVCRDPFKAIEQIISLGISTVLTSGQEKSCEQGAALIKSLVDTYSDKIDILVGAGVTAENISSLAAHTGAKSFHMSGKTNCESRMRYRKSGVPMGLEGISEFSVIRTDHDQIYKAKQALESLSKV